MSSKSPFGSASYFANTGSWKAGSPTSNQLLLKAQSRQLFIVLQQSDSTTESTIIRNKSWRPQLWAAERLAAPLQNQLLLKAQSRQFFIDLQQPHNVAYIKQPRSQSISCSPNLGYLNSLFCKHDATIVQSWWSVLPLLGTSSFWYSREWRLWFHKRHGLLIDS